MLWSVLCCLSFRSLSFSPWDTFFFSIAVICFLKHVVQNVLLHIENIPFKLTLKPYTFLLEMIPIHFLAVANHFHACKISTISRHVQLIVFFLVTNRMNICNYFFFYLIVILSLKGSYFYFMEPKHYRNQPFSRWTW